MRKLIAKGRAAPTCVVDGVLFSTFDVPNLEELEASVQEILQSTVAK